MKIKQIKGVNHLDEIEELHGAMNEKVDFYVKYLENKYKEYYNNTIEYRNIDDTGHNIKILIPF